MTSTLDGRPRDTTGDVTKEELFAAKLNALLVGRGEGVPISQQALAERVGVTRASVNDWCRARSIPAPETVFAVERALDVADGELSRVLGYLPISIEDRPPPTVPEVIARDPRLDDAARRLLTMIYEELAGSTRARRPGSRS